MPTTADRLTRKPVRAIELLGESRVEALTSTTTRAFDPNVAPYCKQLLDRIGVLCIDRRSTDTARRRVNST
jgi:hypothetical protein